MVVEHALLFWRIGARPSLRRAEWRQKGCVMRKTRYGFPLIGVHGVRAIGVAIALAFITGAVSAQTVTWTGTAADANWASGLNWSTGSAPPNGADLDFRGSTRTTSTNTIASGSFGNLSFTNTGAANLTGTFTLSGNAFTLGGNITTTAVTTGTLNDSIGNAITLAATSTATTNSNHNLALSGIISGAGFGITKNGVGMLMLSGVNTFTGPVTLNSGTLMALTSASALGTGGATLALNGGTLVLGVNNGANFGRNTTLNGNASILTGRETSSAVNTTNILGSLVVAQSSTLNVERYNITSTFNGQVTFGSTTLQGNLTVTLGSRGIVQFGAISEEGGPRSFTLEAAGSTTAWVFLNGAGNWTGGTTVKAGTLRAVAAGSLGALGTTTTVSGGELELRNATSATGRHLAFTGDATLRLANNSSTTFLTGTLSQSAGTLTIIGANQTAGSTPTHTLNAADLQLSPVGSLVLSTAAVDIGVILQLSGRSQTIDGFSSTAGSGTTVLANNSGTNVTFTVGANGGSGTFAGQIRDKTDSSTGTLAFVKNGAGTISLSGSNSYTGETSIKGGVLALGTSSAFAGGGILSFGGGALQFSNANTEDYSGRIKNSGSAISIDTNNQSVTFASAIDNTNTSGLTKLGSGTLTLSAVNSFTGTTRSVLGVLTVGNASALAASTLNMNAADAGSVTFSQNSTLGGLTGSRGLDMGTRTLSVGNNNQSTTYSGGLSNGALTKIGSGTLTLGGSNSYAGATRVAAGSLLVNGTLGATAVTVESGALLGGSGLIGGSVTVLAGGTFSPGNSPGLLTSGPLSLAGTTLMEIDGLAPRGGIGGYDATDVSGMLTYGGSMLIDFGSGITSAFENNTTLNLFDFDSWTGSFTSITTTNDGSFYAGLTFVNSGDNDKWTATKGAQTLEFTHSTGTLAIVPEPHAAVIAGCGIAAAAWWLSRRRR